MCWQKRLNLTKTVRKLPINDQLERTGHYIHDDRQLDIKYDELPEVCLHAAMLLLSTLLSLLTGCLLLSLLIDGIVKVAVACLLLCSVTVLWLAELHL